MNRQLILMGSLLGFLAILLGAFAAHGLKEYLSGDQLNSFETGIRYQMYQSLFLLFLGIVPPTIISNKKSILWLTVTGTVLFSGSIYLLSVQTVINVDFSFLGPVTPLGGILMISAWIVLFFNVLKKKE